MRQAADSFRPAIGAICGPGRRANVLLVTSSHCPGAVPQAPGFFYTDARRVLAWASGLEPKKKPTSAAFAKSRSTPAFAFSAANLTEGNDASGRRRSGGQS